MQATYVAVSMVPSLFLDQHVTIKCPHAVHILLTMNRAAQVTAARWNKWSTMLEAPNIIIQRCTTCNPANLMLPPDTTLLELVLDQLSDGFIESSVGKP